MLTKFDTVGLFKVGLQHYMALVVYHNQRSFKELLSLNVDKIDKLTKLLSVNLFRLD